MRMCTTFNIGPVLLIRDGCLKYQTSESVVGCEKCGTNNKANFCPTCGSTIDTYSVSSTEDYTLEDFLEDEDEYDRFYCGDYSTVTLHGCEWTRYLINDTRYYIEVDSGTAFFNFEDFDSSKDIMKLASNDLVKKIIHKFGIDNVDISYGISAVTT